MKAMRILAGILLLCAAAGLIGGFLYLAMLAGRAGVG